MPSKTPSKKSPVCVVTKSDSASLLGSLRKDEINFILNIRSLRSQLQEMFQGMAQDLHDKELIKRRSYLSIVRPASISPIGGGRHV